MLSLEEYLSLPQVSSPKQGNPSAGSLPTLGYNRGQMLERRLRQTAVSASALNLYICWQWLSSS